MFFGAHKHHYSWGFKVVFSRNRKSVGDGKVGFFLEGAFGLSGKVSSVTK